MATLASCGAPRDIRALRATHRFSVSPDDVAIDDAGHLWVTAREANALIELNSNGDLLATRPLPGGPEGVAWAGPALYVAQQNLNAVVLVDTTLRTVATLPNRTANPGIDGIAADLPNRRILVPDSANGQLTMIDLAGAQTPRVLATGLGRPVAAAADPSGGVFVASESTPGLTLIPASGASRTIGHFTNLDEVVYRQGLLYVTELDRHDVVAVDPASGATATIAFNILSPQGLAITSSGTLEIVDAKTNTLYSTQGCGRT